MKSKFLMLFLLLQAHLFFAQIPDTIYIWPGIVPGEAGIKDHPVQAADTSGNVTRLIAVSNPALIVFKPEASVDNGTGIIVCPGGGYHILAIDKEGYEIARWLNKLGFTAFVLQYRVPNKRSEALNDIQRSIRILRLRSSDWGLNPDRLGVLGFSAGGHLCATASTRFDRNVYKYGDAPDSISCRPDFAILIYPAYLDSGENNSLSPEIEPGANTPPVFIFGTTDDPYWNSSIVLARALGDNKLSVEYHLLPTGGHGYGLRTGNPAGEAWPVLAEAWLNRVIEK